ncbi:hypothetical protein AX15_000314 [Amanita polypyramis BW_CC]|nr:hypothetical protein AX15_000314 [Amanita polypyramis BW_CC]
MSLVRSDNDQYSHINNSVYYHLFDSVINTYLIEHCGLSPTSSELIGLVVTSYCNVGRRYLLFLSLTLHHQFFRPLSFPQVLDLGLRVNKLGNSSVGYEVGVFGQGQDEPAAVGGYTHVFVDSKTRRSARMSDGLQSGLEKLLVASLVESKL